MNFELIGNLIRLRYKLLWAKTRSRNGKIALFMAGYLLLVLCLVLFVAGGFGAALVAMRSGKGVVVAQAVLSGFYFQALLTTVMLGFGMNAIFTDTELRRYPLAARARLIVRHFIGIMDPFWFLVLALELGLVVGMYVYGAASFWLGLIAVLLLFISNYLLSRVIGMLLDRLVQRKSGSAILMAMIMLLAFLPGVLAETLRHNHELWESILRVLHFTPPFGAAAALTASGMPALSGLLLVLLWMLVFAAALVALELRPPQKHAVKTTGIAWNSRYESVGALFGERNAPFVAHWLRFYMRNSRFRTLYMLSLPLVAFLTYNYGRKGGATGWFVAALGTFPIATFMGTSRIAVNQFGYTGSGFRRYFLLPTAPAACLRAGSYAAVLLGSLMIPIAAIAWVVFIPGAFDARMLFMVVGSAVTGLFVFHALGLWATLFGPRKGNYNSSFGNDLSAVGNVVVIGAVLAGLFLPQILKRVLPAAVSPESWWIVLPAIAAAVVFYLFSLRAAGALLETRREQLMAVVEGRD